jgi:hypothetical protein
MKTSNEQVLNNFLNGIESMNHTQNLFVRKENGCIVLINYRTIIAKITNDNMLLINCEKYSRTTSKHTNYLKRSGHDFELVNEEQIQAAHSWKGIRLNLLFK